jgi:hypothetical protein
MESAKLLWFWVTLRTCLFMVIAAEVGLSLFDMVQVLFCPADNVIWPDALQSPPQTEAL